MYIRLEVVCLDSPVVAGAGAVFINVSVLTLSTSYLAPSTWLMCDMDTQDTCHTLYNATLLIISI